MAKTKIVPTNIREVLSHSMKQFNHEMQLQKAIETSVALKLKINELERKRKEIDQKSKQEEENAELEEESTRGPPGSDQPTEHVAEKESCPTKAESVTEKMLTTTEVASLNKERGKPRGDKPAGGGFPNVGCINSDCSLVGSRRCAGCQSFLYCGEVRSKSLLETRASRRRSVNIVNIFHAGLCFSRLGCAQEQVQGQGQGEEDEEG